MLLGEMVKIVNRKKFLEMPTGTVFCKGKPWCWGNISVKHDTRRHNNGEGYDFIYQKLDHIDSDDSGEWVDKQQHALDSGESISYDNEATVRDGCFDDEDIFMIYEPDDLCALIAILQSCQN